MTFPVARAATRFVLNRSAANGEKVIGLSFITGVGAAASNRASRENKQRGSPRLSGTKNRDKKALSLRDYIQQVLREDFHPPINSFVPKRAQGTIEIDKSEHRDT